MPVALTSKHSSWARTCELGVMAALVSDQVALACTGPIEELVKASVAVGLVEGALTSKVQQPMPSTEQLTVCRHTVQYKLVLQS